MSGRNIMFSRLSCLCLLSFLTCFVATSSEAGVCFVTGGDCGQKIAARARMEATCDASYNKTAESCCDKDTVANMCRSVPDGESCIQDGVMKYESCTCNPAYYTFSNSSTKYDYHDQCGNKYHWRSCKAKYEYVTTGDYDDFATQLKNKGYGTVKKCETSILEGDSCTEDYAGVVRATGCQEPLCDTGTYKYTSVSDSNVFKLSGTKCTDKNGDHYPSVACTDKVVSGGTWKASCGTSETYSSSEDKTYGGKTCHLCTVKTCQEKNSKWYSSTQKSGLANGTRFTWISEGSGKDGDCYHTTGCATGYVTSSNKSTTIFTYDSGVTIGDYTCFAANGCATNYVLSTAKDTTHFTYSSGTTQNGKTCHAVTGCATNYVLSTAKNTTYFTYGSGTSQGGKTCHAVTGCATNYVLSTAKNTTYFTYGSGTSQGGKTCHAVTGCATNYVLSTAKDTTHFTYGSGTSQGGKTCSAATGCASAYSTTVNGSPVKTTKDANGNEIKCYNKLACSVGQYETAQACTNAGKICYKANNNCYSPYVCRNISSLKFSGSGSYGSSFSKFETYSYYIDQNEKDTNHRSDCSGYDSEVYSRCGSSCSATYNLNGETSITVPFSTTSPYDVFSLNGVNCYGCGTATATFNPEIVWDSSCNCHNNASYNGGKGCTGSDNNVKYYATVDKSQVNCSSSNYKYVYVKVYNLTTDGTYFGMTDNYFRDSTNPNYPTTLSSSYITESSFCTTSGTTKFTIKCRNY